MMRRSPQFVFITLIFLFGLIHFPACKSCKKNCVNGTCQSRECVCDQGWEGEDCNVAWSEKFIGSYATRQFCDNGITYPNCSLTAHIDSIIKLNIHNFHGSGEMLGLELENEMEFTIPQQSIGALQVFGNGRINTNLDTIRIWYAVFDSTQRDSCITDFIKQ